MILRKLHIKGITHGKLKPSNILVKNNKSLIDIELNIHFLKKANHSNDNAEDCDIFESDISSE